MYDNIIIGAGPIGIYLSFLLKNKGLKVLVLEGNKIVGGQLSMIYPDKNIYNIPGHKKITAQNLINTLMDQANIVDDLLCNTPVISIDKINDFFIVNTDSKSFNTKSISITIGNGELLFRPLGVDNEPNIKNLNYTINNINDLLDKNIAIFGGGDSAVDWALHLDKISKSTHLIHHRDIFRAHETNVSLLEQGSCYILKPYILSDYKIINNNLTSLSLMNKNDQSVISIDVDQVICNFGFIKKSLLLENTNIKTNNNKIVVDQHFNSNIKGIFSIGDAINYQNRNNNLITGFGEASSVSNYIKDYLTKEENNNEYRRTNQKDSRSL